MADMTARAWRRGGRARARLVHLRLALTRPSPPFTSPVALPPRRPSTPSPSFPFPGARLALGAACLCVFDGVVARMVGWPAGSCVANPPQALPHAWAFGSEQHGHPYREVADWPCPKRTTKGPVERLIRKRAVPLVVLGLSCCGRRLFVGCGSSRRLAGLASSLALGRFGSHYLLEIRVRWRVGFLFLVGR